MNANKTHDTLLQILTLHQNQNQRQYAGPYEPPSLTTQPPNQVQSTTQQHDSPNYRGRSSGRGFVRGRGRGRGNGYNRGRGYGRGQNTEHANQPSQGPSNENDQYDPDQGETRDRQRNYWGAVQCYLCNQYGHSFRSCRKFDALQTFLTMNQGNDNNAPPQGNE